MTNPNDGAFPGGYNGERIGGLSVREYFALHIMAGLGMDTANTWEKLAQSAVKGADALIAALNRERP